MVEELARLHHELPGLTVLYVTHDQTEALTLAHRIAILRDGRLVAWRRPRSLSRATEPIHRRVPGPANLPAGAEALEEGGAWDGALRGRDPAGPRAGSSSARCFLPALRAAA
jgi:2-aminoethylphosphonate transport system ATP-binding protein